MRPKTLVFLTAVLLSQASLAVGQGSSSGNSGSTGSSGAASGAPGTSTGTPQNSVPSGTGPRHRRRHQVSRSAFHRTPARRELVQPTPASQMGQALRRRPRRLNLLRCPADRAAQPDRHSVPAPRAHPQRRAWPDQRRHASHRRGSGRAENRIRKRGVLGRTFPLAGNSTQGSLFVNACAKGSLPQGCSWSRRSAFRPRLPPSQPKPSRLRCPQCSIAAADDLTARRPRGASRHLSKTWRDWIK